MSEDKCPFCGEPVIRHTVQGDYFRCGTLGPDINGDYSTGRICDISTYQRLLAAKEAEIERLRAMIEPEDRQEHYEKQSLKYALKEGSVSNRLDELEKRVSAIECRHEQEDDYAREQSEYD